MTTVAHPPRHIDFQREAEDMFDRHADNHRPTRLDLTPRKAAPRLPCSIDEVDVRNIQCYPHSDCPLIVTATYGGKTRHAIFLVHDRPRRLVCVAPIVAGSAGSHVQQPITIDDAKVHNLPHREVPAHIGSAAMTFIANLRDERVVEMTEWLDDINRERALEARNSRPGCDELGDHGPLSISSSSGSQHAA